VDRAERARATAAMLVADQVDGTRWLGHEAVVELMAPYGLNPIGNATDDSGQAAKAAEKFGFPVAVKVADPNVLHKTDRGLVQVGLTSPAAVTGAYRSFADELGTEQVSVLVQPMVGGIEVALGVIRDPGFGPLVMVAAGGVATEILADRAFLMPPFSQQDAARAIRSLRIWPLLQGYRGGPHTDVGTLELMLVALGELATDVPELSEVDLNPVMCQADGVVVVDAKVGLRVVTSMNAGVPRQLRET
jgi:acyl-CoA synthetase (NDP forming)